MKVERIAECSLIVDFVACIIDYFCLGLPTRNGERHVSEIANLALDVLHMSRSKKFPTSEHTPIQLQIGINTGKLIYPFYCRANKE